MQINILETGKRFGEQQGISYLQLRTIGFLDQNRKEETVPTTTIYTFNITLYYYMLLRDPLKLHHSNQLCFFGFYEPN